MIAYEINRAGRRLVGTACRAGAVLAPIPVYPARLFS